MAARKPEVYVLQMKISTCCLS